MMGRFFLSGREALVAFAALAFVALASIAAFLFVDARVEATLSARQAAVVDSELRYLQLVDAEEGREALIRFVVRRASVANDDLPIHALVDPSNHYLAGDVDWPPDVVTDGRWRPIETNKRNSGETVTGFGRAVRLPDGAKVLVGRDQSAHRIVKSALIEAIMAALAVLLIVAAGLVILLNRRVLGRIDAIASAARGIIAGNLHDRIPLDRSNNEFDRLSRVLNTMLERNETHIAQMRLVTEAVAHDLRMPLQRVKAELERVQASGSDTDRERALAKADDEIDGALATFNALLEITRAESGIGVEGFEAIDLAAVVRNVVELFEPVAEDRSQSVTAEVVPVTVKGQGTLLRQALGNLLQNAIKFSAEGAAISVRLRDEGSAAVIIVEDNGPGIPAGELSTALRPFGRLSRDAATDGKGLGLALVAACAKLHRGNLQLEPANPGLRVVFTLPKGF